MTYEEPNVILNGQDLMSDDFELTKPASLAAVVATLAVVAIAIVVWNVGALVNWVAAAVAKGAAAVTNVGIGIDC